MHCVIGHKQYISVDRVQAYTTKSSQTLTMTFGGQPSYRATQLFNLELKVSLRNKGESARLTRDDE
jgi:hypothetical protein